MPIRFLLLFAAIACIGSSAWALVIKTFNANQHERFANDAAFIGNPHDWSGVGRHTIFGTMVSNTFCVTARHRKPATGAPIVFYHSNDTDGGTETHTVAETWQIGTSDLSLVRLNSSVSEAVRKYAIADINVENVAGRTIHTFGRGSSGPVSHQQRMGTNVINQGIAGFTDRSLGGPGDIFIYAFDSSAGPNETRVEGGDSGAPTFIITPSGPLLVGVHWFNFTDNDTGLRGTGDTLIPSHIAAMNTIMSGFGEQLTVTAVP